MHGKDEMFIPPSPANLTNSVIANLACQLQCNVSVS